jgi:putative Mn2+ efflux pump MntP
MSCSGWLEGVQIECMFEGKDWSCLVIVASTVASTPQWIAFNLLIYIGLYFSKPLINDFNTFVS